MKREFVIGLLKNVTEKHLPHDEPCNIDLGQVAASSLEVLEGIGVLDLSKAEKKPVDLDFLRRCIQNEYNIIDDDRPLGGIEVAHLAMRVMGQIGLIPIAEVDAMIEQWEIDYQAKKAEREGRNRSNPSTTAN
jgi:hypothetical protein